MNLNEVQERLMTLASQIQSEHDSQAVADLNGLLADVRTELKRRNPDPALGQFIMDLRHHLAHKDTATWPHDVLMLAIKQFAADRYAELFELLHGWGDGAGASR